MKQTVLLAGATGMLGHRIAHHLLEQPEAKVRLLVRRGISGDKKTSVDVLMGRGAEVVEGELGDTESLDRATRGVDVIVSAVQGGPDIIVEGQVRLAEIGKRNGVRRILPSDFGLDIFKATPGEHAAFNARQRADEIIASLGLEHIHMLQGAFLDLFGPGSPVIDYEKGLVTFWGDGHQKVEATSVDDTARMTARVAVDRNVANGKFAFAGDRLSFQEAANIAEEQTGHAFTRQSLGTEAQLRAAMHEASRNDPFQHVMLAYQLYMLNGQTSLDHLQSDRYPDIYLASFSEFLAKRQASRSTGNGAPR